MLFRSFRYVLNPDGTIVTSTAVSWNLDTANAAPTGITLDPSQTSGSLWVVDSGTDRIYEYSNARGATAGTLSATYALTTGNTNPQGIADPPPSGNRDGKVSVAADLLGGSTIVASPIARHDVAGTQVVSASSRDRKSTRLNSSHT